MSTFRLQRVNGPILQPSSENSWESRAVFNPGTVREGETIHMLYRAVEGDNYSTIGYARLNREGQILERKPKPVIIQESDIEKRGCEDPRIVRFENVNYIFYTGFDGANPPLSINTRVMLARTEDFITYRKLGMIGPDEQDKDAMIFPERISGKLVFIHRVIPDIQIAVFDDMDHLLHPEADYWPQHLKHIRKYTLMYPEYHWEVGKIGTGPPPIQTEAGWLMIYHGVDKEKVYRAGAALIDEKNPYRIIARLPYPILEPETDYEKWGDVNMVVFPEGITHWDDDLYVYYGAADKVIGLAMGKLSHLIAELWRNRL